MLGFGRDYIAQIAVVFNLCRDVRYLQPSDRPERANTPITATEFPLLIEPFRLDTRSEIADLFRLDFRIERKYHDYRLLI